MTRGRASFPEGVVSGLHVQYYTQRSSGGFLLTEATGISRRGLGWYRAPGIYTAEQIDAWKTVTESVHGAGGKVYLQLWHMGRCGHSDVFSHPPLAPSAITVEGEQTAAHPSHGTKPYEIPEVMTQEQIQETVGDYKQAALNAIEAGFDGCQIHSANGYLIDQFLQPVSNQRDDEYGGSLDNRLRFLKEVLEAVTGAVGPDKTWIRFSPNGSFQGMGCADNLQTFDAAIQLAASFKIAVIEVLDGIACHGWYSLERARKNANIGNPDTANPTAIMGNVGHTQVSANREIGNGHADLISFGRIYMSNPDLPERFAMGLPLADPPAYRDWWTKEDGDGLYHVPECQVT
jgi:N-ethylmaleimide reductase